MFPTVSSHMIILHTCSDSFTNIFSLMCTHVYTQVYTYIGLNKCTDMFKTYMHDYTCDLFTDFCTHLYLYAYLCTCLRACLCKFTHIFTFMFTYVYTYDFNHVYTHILKCLQIILEYTLSSLKLTSQKTVFKKMVTSISSHILLDLLPA